MSWSTALPVEAKVVARVRASLLEDGVVKVSFSETVLKGATACLVQFGSGESAGLMRIQFGPMAPDMVAIKPFAKGGGYCKCRPPSVVGLEGLSTKSAVCGVEGVREGELIVRLPKRIAASVPRVETGGGGVKPGLFNMVGYMKSAGYTASKVGGNSYIVNKMRYNRVEMLREVNKHRASVKPPLPSVRLEDCE
jgi:hypothetical protein